MAKRRKPRPWERHGPSGFVTVDKPGGLTSHDVVDAARRWFGTRQVGHLGTLDPLATGSASPGDPVGDQAGSVPHQR